MKAKKLIPIVLLAAMGTSTQAQIVTSVTDQVVVIEQPKEKKPRTFKWNLRVGYSFDMMTGGDNLSAAPGVDGSFGISKPFRNERLFWGVEAGYMTYGSRVKACDVRCLGHVISVNPRIGIKFRIGQKMSLSLYGGPYLGCIVEGDKESGIDWVTYKYYTDAEGNYHTVNDYRSDMLKISGGDIDFGINMGTEFFVNKYIFFNLYIKKGFLKTGKQTTWWRDEDYYYSFKDVKDIYERKNNKDEENPLSALKIVLGVGVQF